MKIISCFFIFLTFIIDSKAMAADCENFFSSKNLNEVLEKLSNAKTVATIWGKYRPEETIVAFTEQEQHN